MSLNIKKKITIINMLNVVSEKKKVFKPARRTGCDTYHCVNMTGDSKQSTIINWWCF